MLFAERDITRFALASDVAWLAPIGRFVGVSDGWQELRANKRLTSDLHSGRERERRSHGRDAISAHQTVRS
jgi:hypothetical protein